MLPRDIALDLLWPEADPGAAVNNLNQSVFQLRRVLDPDYRDGESPQYLISSVDSLQLDPELVRTDLNEFRALAARINSPLSLADRRSTLEKMVDLIRGEFLADLKYEEWMPRVETGVHSEVRQALLPVAEGGSDSPDLCVRAASTLMLLDEFDESATLAMVQQLSATGRRSAAREVILRFAEKIQRELDESPSPELSEAIRILTPHHRVSLPT